ncbi:MAG: UDP-N-acetylmuramoyl-tripeptide--D-alanyl-D-alanine ligase, partial [Alphaproteobacteria bacterium]|nr:UDP-N-acetylmuramoyl-tripeptide--D-alanyl-D-alanine ligase [Alphaproteobacteria bacterium]
KDKICLKKVVGITGSVGNTTTRSWLTTVLSREYRTFSSIRNYNTIYGLPISLSLLEPGTEFGVFEMGSSNSGEIAELSQYLEPDIGVITNIYESHIGRFGSKEALAHEKISIVEGIRPGGALVFDGDCEFADDIRLAATSKQLQCFSVGFSQDCDFCILLNSPCVELHTPTGVLRYEVPFTGKHFAYITACVVAIIHAMELDIRVFLPFFKELSLLDGRGAIKKCKYAGKIFDVIDDSYNAGPSAMLAALNNLSTKQAPRKIAVIGQMGELGDFELHYHQLVAEKLSSMNLAHVFFIGSETLWNTMRVCENVECFAQMSDFVIEKMLKIIQNGDIVLLKGSRSVGLDRFLDYVCSTT